MESRAKLFGHPVHQMLIVLPLGALVTALLADAVGLLGGRPFWSEMAFWLIVVGTVTGLLAAPFGYIDWKAIPVGTRAKRVGAMHGIGNMAVLFFFGLSCLMRLEAPASPDGPAVTLAFMGGALALVTSWLGGELVDRLAIGVDDNAGVNAPSSLSNTRAGGGGRTLRVP